MLSGKKKGKIQIAKKCDGVIVPAMRENPTPATGPVSIKHVRNTVPKLHGAQSTPVSQQPFITTGSYAAKAYGAALQLGTTTL